MKTPVDFRPGARWQYSDQGYFLLGRILEKVSGRSYHDFMTERVFKPLGMNATTTVRQSAIVKNLASGYTREGGTRAPLPFRAGSDRARPRPPACRRTQGPDSTSTSAPDAVATDGPSRPQKPSRALPQPAAPSTASSRSPARRLLQTSRVDNLLHLFRRQQGGRRSRAGPIPPETLRTFFTETTDPPRNPSPRAIELLSDGAIRMALRGQHPEKGRAPTQDKLHNPD
jgi:hypothetical protein